MIWLNRANSPCTGVVLAATVVAPPVVEGVCNFIPIGTLPPGVPCCIPAGMMVVTLPGVLGPMMVVACPPVLLLLTPGSGICLMTFRVPAPPAPGELVMT